MRILFATAIACLSTVGVTLADSAQATIRKSVNIREQALHAALQELSEERGIHFVFVADDVMEFHTNGAQGSLTLDEALDQLLEGTNLTYQYIDDETISILPLTRSSNERADSTMVQKTPSNAAASLSSSAGAFYQSQGSSGSQSQSQSASPRNGEADASVPIDEVIVTTTRLRRSGFEAPTPLTTVSKEALDARGVTNIADYLREVPAFTPSATPQSTTLTSINNGANFMSLRGLGPHRTLILVNGRRHVSTTFQGFVDLNVIPQSLIQRIDVITGGASAAWGSDAVAGVVNVITDSALDGIKVDAQFGQTSHGDGENRMISLAAGGFTNGQAGHFTIGAEFVENDGVLAQSDRDWGRKRWGIVNNPLDTGPDDGIPARIITPGVILGFGTDGGYFSGAASQNAPIVNLQFGPGGEVLPYDTGVFPYPQNLATLPLQVGGDGKSMGDDADLSSPFTRKALMATFDYRFSNQLRFFSEATYGESRGTTQTHQSWNFGASIAIDNAFLPDPIREAMSTAGTTTASLYRINTDHGFITADTTTKTTRFVGGFDGEFSPNWDWSVYFQSGRTDGLSLQHNNLILANNQFAIDAVVDPVSGQIVCRANLNGANGAPRCVPLNLFGDGSPSQAAIDYVLGTSFLPSDTKQTVVAATVRGESLELPGGPLTMAFGGEHRTESTSANADKTARTRGYLIANISPFSGEYDVTEGFLELGAPVIGTDSGLKLDLNGAFRYTDYSTSGPVETWKGGLVFSPFGDLTLRGTVSRDIRAPNLNELFAPQVSFPNVVVDPRSGIPTFIFQTFGGNPNLKEESADTTTFGVVYRPSWLDGLQLSVDAYDIDIRQAIGAVSPQETVNGCFIDSDPSLCALITLNPSGAITNVEGINLNLAKRRTSGIDFEAAYTTTVGDGDLDLRLLANHTDKQEVSTDGVITIDNNGVVGNHDAFLDYPEWKANLLVNYALGNLGTTVQVRYVDGGLYRYGLTAEDINDNTVEGRTYLNLGARYVFEFWDRRLEAYGGVNNVFDKDPPVAPIEFFVNIGTNPALYDVIGRFYYGGLRLQF